MGGCRTDVQTDLGWRLMFGLKEKYAEWKEARFLKKHGCENREQYDRWFDPDINKRASVIRDYYQGYPYVYCFENHEHPAYRLVYDFGPGGVRYRYNDILDWCKDKCADKYRLDIHRVIKYPSTGNQWTMNDIGGFDYIFVAFKNREDYFLFTLKWS